MNIPPGRRNRRQDKQKKQQWDSAHTAKIPRQRRRITDAPDKLPEIFPTNRCKLRLLKFERINDFLLIEDEYVQTQERASTRDRSTEAEMRKIENMRGSPMAIGTLEELIDDDHAIVSTASSPEMYVYIMSFVNRNQLEPGCTVILNHKDYTVTGVLQDDEDVLTHVMKLEKAPKETYADVGGLEVQIQEIKDAVELPLTHGELYAEIGISPPKGVILYGPPGTGKTLIAKAVANQTSASFMHVVGSELVQKYLGEGPKLVRELFKIAKQNAPTILFIDEVDAIGSKRFDSTSGGEREIQRTLLELLNQLDGFDTLADVKVIMATNRIDTLDPALIRPGRIDRKIEFPLPDAQTKLKIFTIHTGRMALASDVDVSELIQTKNDLSGADIKAVCTEAGLLALRERRVKVTMNDFRMAKERVLVRRNTGNEELYL